MNLRDIANDTLNNFDVESNPNQTSDFGVPAGTYDVIVDQSGHRVYDSGYDAVAIRCEVVTGDQAGKKELINIDLDGEYLQTYPNLLKQNIQLIGQLAYVTNTTLTDDDWESEDTVGNAFAGIVGEQFILNVEKGKTKKGKEYTNYSFEKYPDADKAIEINDDELPFD